ncbi:HET-domain-containing protein [Decorospora gaudefroyi]|uniref:HET-domain-containing protein n=1 Tax=Decorospora gaudefroyi TaxID=184978 RepID=A0A6A5JWK0_9PLEO|nr:HET-domain-containing protein [Decorospora gaudefroyi]
MDGPSSNQHGKRRRWSDGSGDYMPERNRYRPSFDPTSPRCTECQMLDLDSSFEEAWEHYASATNRSKTSNNIHQAHDGRHFYNDAVLVHRFGARLSIPSDCPLCQFFRSLRVQPDLYERHKLLAFGSSDAWLFKADELEETRRNTSVLDNYIDTVFMAVVPDIESLPSSAHDVSWLDYEIPAVGAIFRRSIWEDSGNGKQNLLGAEELEDAFDLGRARGWLNACRQEHGTACEQRASQEPVTRGFRLIDCTKTPPAVEGKPWGTPYAALSYVWGSTPADLEEWPKTVMDAVEVANKLGCQYLWVDRLCINQKDPDEKGYLISRMTTIYEAAEFTVVATAGSGASHGLPGVRSTPRKPQPKYYLDNGSLLLSILPDPRREILESPYWTRGWTYQEGVLSNRRMVFTEYQTYWECRCMASHESVDMPLFHTPATREDDPNSVLIHFMLTGIFKGGAYSGGSSAHQDNLVIAVDEAYRLDYGFPLFQEMTVGSQLRGLAEHIREFSKRHLTHDTDSLLAFQGVVGMYEQTKPLYLFHGIPMWTGDIAGSAVGPQVTLALSVSSWYHGSHSDNDNMFVSEVCRRRTHLPSWTWAGWNGTVTWRAPPNLEHCAYMRDLIKAISPSLVWAASIYLSHPGRQAAVRLLGTQSAARLAEETLTTIEIRDPILLNSFNRVEDIDREWKWGKHVGRAGREEIMSYSSDKEVRWYRIGGRLSFIAMSVAMTSQQWTAKHVSGELISVLMFAGRYCDVEHGTARFLTLRRVGPTPARWERVVIKRVS